MSRLVRKYLTDTFAIMLVCWGGCAVCSFLGVNLAEWPVLYLPYFLGGLSPTVAAYLALKQTGAVSNFKEWLKITFDFRHTLWAYLLVPVFAACFFFVLCTVSSHEKGAPLFALVFMVPMMLFGGGLEEAGWRGVLQPELEKMFGYTIATVVVALIWWFWHLPLFFIQGVSQFGGDFLAFGLNVFGLSFALAAIKRNTGSTWLCVLFHCLINSLHGVYLVVENRLGSLAAASALILLCVVFEWVQKKWEIFS